ncbi:MAG: hypothetical protein AB7L90_07670 [Hyphomicrobiaceae bacterium]
MQPDNKQPEIEAYRLTDDGLVPNNPTIPALVYRGAFRNASEREIETHFKRNGWSNAWVNGIYPFHHYHATVHEVLGVASGSAQVQFGGPAGPVLELTAGDAVLIPAGVGHCRIDATSDLSVVGAYPGGADYDLVRATADAHGAAREKLKYVTPPPTDPVFGRPFRIPA